MRIGSENQGEFGWYDGELQFDSYDESYRLNQGDRSARIPGSDLLDGVFEDRVDHDVDVMLYGRLGVEERLTGNFGFELLNVDQAAAVLEEDYEGWTVGVARREEGYDLIFTEDNYSTVYRAASLEELEKELMDWFDDYEGYRNTVEDWEWELDNWPWND
ncbi:MAG: hypothetical protein ABEJ03_00680 [Candidatus Nanohaloarchaea archaeon]